LKDLAAILRSDAGYNTVFTLDMAGEGTGDVMFQDRQIDALRGRLVHADLRRLSKGEKIEVTVSIHLIGEAAGLDEEGAVLNQQLREVKVLCEPRNIPDFIEVDVSSLEASGAIHVSDINVDKGFEIQEAPETVVASIVIVREEELEPQPESIEPEVTEEGGGEKPGAITGEGDTEQP